MKRCLFALLLLSVVTSVFSYNEEDLKRFQETGKCPGGDLRGADLRDVIKKLNDNKPNDNSDTRILRVVRKGRHPVVEKFLVPKKNELIKKKTINLQGAKLTDVNFSESDFSKFKVDCSSAKMDGARFDGARFGNEAIFKNANLVDSNFEKVVARRAQFEGAILSGGCLREGDFKGANFTGANLQGGDLSKSELENATLRWAKLKGAKFYRTNLKNADFKGVYSVEEATFDHSNVRDVEYRLIPIRYKIGLTVGVIGFSWIVNLFF